MIWFSALMALYESYCRATAQIEQVAMEMFILSILMTFSTVY